MSPPAKLHALVADPANSLAEATNCFTEETSDLAKVANSSAKTNLSFAETTNCLAERNLTLAKPANCPAKKNISLADTTNCLAEETSVFALKDLSLAERDLSLVKNLVPKFLTDYYFAAGSVAHFSSETLKAALAFFPI